MFALYTFHTKVDSKNNLLMPTFTGECVKQWQTINHLFIWQVQLLSLIDTKLETKSKCKFSIIFYIEIMFLHVLGCPTNLALLGVQWDLLRVGTKQKPG